MNKINNGQIYLFVFFMCFSSGGFCYGVTTHKEISYRAFESSKLADLIQQNKLTEIGITSSTTLLNGVAANGHTYQRYIQDWIGEGAVDEDCCEIGYWRFLNHFYNPITNSGLRSSPNPSLEWGLELNGDIGNQEYSYKDARQYYLDSLIMVDPNVREQSLAKTFYTLGHVIHLLQDLAQPQHTRGEAHSPWLPRRGFYEEWTDAVVGTLPFNNFPNIYPGESQLFNAPIKFWRTSTYPNYYGDGLAEYSNYNFLTQYLNCNNNELLNPVCLESQQVTVPNIQSLCTGPTQDAVACSLPTSLASTLTNDQYTTMALTFQETDISGPSLASHQGVNDRASTKSLFDPYLENLGYSPVWNQNRFNFRRAHQFLIPQAVGYSVGMINYFFRGSIDASVEPSGNIVVKNTSDEDMDGFFRLYYDDASDRRHPVQLANCPVPNCGAGRNIPIPHGQTASLGLLTEPTSPPPKEPGKYILVFKGKRGQEENAIAGKVFTVLQQNRISVTRHTCGIRSDNTVDCWGYNYFGQATPPVGTFLQVSAGAYHTCGIRSDHSITCWGRNSFGEATPPAGYFLQISAGSSLTCGIRYDHTLACWGYGGEWQATTVPYGTFIQVSAGGESACAIRSDNTVTCWGYNYNIDEEYFVPRGDFLQLSTENFTTCGVRIDNAVICWDANSNPGEWLAPPSDTFLQVGTGFKYACGIRTDHTVACWGTVTGQVEPPLGTFLQIDVGYANGCGILSEGTVKCWGSNQYGQATPPLGSFIGP